MASSPTAFMAVRCYAIWNLMAPRANQGWSNVVGTRHWIGVTFAFMVLLTVTSPTSMKVRVLRHSTILHFPLALLFFWYFKPSCYGHSPLHLVASIPL